jgi:Mn2+/Fe2+ NRAMP family transporter
MNPLSATVLPFPTGDRRRSRHRMRDFFQTRLPGVVAGAADLDPAAVLTATVAGATFGLSIAWVVLICFPVLRSVFHVSARIGHESRKGLVELTREHYGRNAGLLLAIGIVAVNMTMIVGDLVVVSDAWGVVLNQPRLFFLAPMAFFVWYLLLLGNVDRITKWMGVLAFLLISYVAAAYMATPSTISLLKGILLPHIQVRTDYALGVIALFGSLLTPDVIVWQTSSRRDAPQGVVKSLHPESHAGTFVACLISISAIVAASHMQVVDPANMSTRDAAEALGPLGVLGPLVFSIGILGSGLVALPLLAASLCFSVAEALDWKSGLNKKPWDARYFFIMISACLFIGTVIGLFKVNTVRVLYWSQVLAGFMVMPILGLLILLGRNRSIVQTSNTRAENIWLGVAVVAMAVANILFLVTSVL